MTARHTSSYSRMVIVFIDINPLNATASVPLLSGQHSVNSIATTKMRGQLKRITVRATSDASRQAKLEALRSSVIPMGARYLPTLCSSSTSSSSGIVSSSSKSFSSSSLLMEDHTGPDEGQTSPAWQLEEFSQSTGVPTPKLTPEQLKGKTQHLKRFYENVTIVETTAKQLIEAEQGNSLTNTKQASQSSNDLKSILSSLNEQDKISSGQGDATFSSTLVPDQDQLMYQVCLDDKLLRTPDRNPLLIPSRVIAEAIKEEWAAQRELILPDSMPMQSLACTAIDQIQFKKKDHVEQLLPYLETDTICFLDDSPEKLVKLQKELWQPVREAFEKRYGVDVMVVEGGSLAIDNQPDETVEKVSKALLDLSIWQIAAVDVATGLCKSLIIGMGLTLDQHSANRIIAGSAKAIEASYLEETFQSDFWGEDQSFLDKKVSLKDWLDACELFAREMP